MVLAGFEWHEGKAALVQCPGMDVLNLICPTYTGICKRLRYEEAPHCDSSMEEVSVLVLTPN
jgi:hypothetical protein